MGRAKEGFLGGQHVPLVAVGAVGDGDLLAMVVALVALGGLLDLLRLLLGDGVVGLHVHVAHVAGSPLAPSVRHKRFGLRLRTEFPTDSGKEHVYVRCTWRYF